MSKTMPIGWAQVTLGEIVQPTRPRVDPGEFPKLPYVGLEHVESETMELLGTHNSRDISSSCTKFATSDVLYARMRPNLSKVWVADRDGLCSTEFIVLPRSPDLNSHFLAFRLNSVEFVGFAVQQVTGDRPRVSFEQLASFAFLLPPLAEQERIVVELLSRLATVRRGVERLRRAKAKLRDYRRSVMASAAKGKLHMKHTKVTSGTASGNAAELAQSLIDERRQKIRMAATRSGDQTKISLMTKLSAPTAPEVLNAPSKPDTWVWVSVDQLAWDSGYGTSTRCTVDGKGLPVLRIPNIEGGKINEEDMKYAVDQDALDEEDWIAPGDLLIIRTNGSRDLIGRAAIVQEVPSRPTGFASYLIRFRLVGSAILWDWVNLVWNSPAYRPLLENMASTTAGQYNVSVSGLRSFPLALPPSTIQQALLREVESRLKSSGLLETRIIQQMERARDQRRSLVQEAFSGTFVEQLATDEPAATLVERLRRPPNRNESAEGRQTEGEGQGESGA